MRGAVAFLATVAATVAGLSAAFSTPASAAGRTHQTVSADTTTLSPAAPRHFAAPQPRAPAPCETRGCRAASFPPIYVVVVIVHELPGHRYQSTACAYEFASRPAVAGGDPVNESDPTGLVAAPFPNASDCVEDNSEPVCPIGTAPNGSPTYSPNVCQNIVAFGIGPSSVATECPTGGSVSFDQALMSGLDSFNHSGLNPVYDFLTSVRNEVDVDEDPCSTGWDEFVAGANVVASTVSLGLVAGGPLADGVGGAEAVEQWASRGDAGAITPPTLTPWGWTASGSYRAAVGLVDQGGDVTDVLGTIPTQAQAEQLIADGGGTIQRVEVGHPPGGVSTHSYPHINYYTSSGVRSAIRITQVESP